MGVPGKHAEPERLAEFQRLRREGWSIAEACRHLDLSWNTGKKHDPARGARPIEVDRISMVAWRAANGYARDDLPEDDIEEQVEREVERRLARLGGHPDPDPRPRFRTIEDGPPVVSKRDDEVDESKGTRSITMHVDRPVKTLDDLIEACEIDTTTWMVEKWECSAWGVPMKLHPGGWKDQRGQDIPLQTQQFRVKATLKRILPKARLDAVKAIFEDMKAHAPRYPKVVTKFRPDDPHMLEVDLFDHHFGKLAWHVETGEDYDLKIAERYWKEAVADLMSKVAGYEIDTFLIPVGNDMLHFDNPRNTTTSGTPMDTDGRLCKVYRAAKRSIIGTVEEMASSGKTVLVELVQGNHDETLAYTMVELVDAWFHNVDHVRVNSDPKKRKYVRYGTNLIGFTHGNMKNLKGLPNLMATEAKQDWAETTQHEWHLGHLHQEKKYETQPVETVDGVTVRYLKSLCGTDSWHFENGYVGGRRAAEAYLWSFDRGLSGMFNGYISA